MLANYEKGKAIKLSVSFPSNWEKMVVLKYPKVGWPSAWMQEAAREKLDRDGCFNAGSLNELKEQAKLEKWAEAEGCGVLVETLLDRAIEERNEEGVVA